MALILVFGVAFASYQKYNSESESDPEVDLTGKTNVELLPLENTVLLMEAPLATITFCKGDYNKAAEYLRARVADIAYRNPWIGGWLAKDPTSKDLRLWYDPSSDDLAPGLLLEFQPGEIPVHRELSYDECHELVNSRGAKVLRKAELSGKNEPIVKISIIPDEANPTERFSLVTSMSHAGGDKHTYYKIFNMLCKGTEILVMNPVRKMEAIDAVFKRMGQKESFYIRNALKEPMWAFSQSKENRDPMQLKIFYPNLQWSVDGSKQQLNQESDGDESIKLMPRQSDYAVLASWFFGINVTTVGFLAVNYRNYLERCDLNDMDAGNYQNPIPLTAVDYATPRLVQLATESGKRCGTNPIAPLPNHQAENSYSIAVDWAESRDAAIDIGDGIEEQLHLPLYSSKELRSVPNKMSFMVLFTANGKTEYRRKRIALFVVAKKSVIDKIDESGIVDEVIYVEDS